MKLYEIPITEIKGVGDQLKKIFNKINIATIEDLFHHIPRNYGDRSFSHSIQDANSGEVQSFYGQIIKIDTFRPKKKILITKAIFEYITGQMSLVWFNQPFLKNQIKLHQDVRISGKVLKNYQMVKMENPEIEYIKEGEELPKIVPFYSLTQGLSQNRLRAVMKKSLETFVNDKECILPPSIIQRYDLLHPREALWEIHFPTSFEKIAKSRHSLIFEELMVFQLSTLSLKKRLQQGEKGIPMVVDGRMDIFRKSLPFTLTEGQCKVIDDIFSDMKSENRMHRLLQGDVGSGKTVVAFMALLLAVNNGYQGILMAPTELLAQQHFEAYKSLLLPLGIRGALLTGSTKAKDKNQIKQDLKEGNIDLIIGTHALIEEDVAFLSLGLVITDEQHRFGVFQRYRLSTKGQNPHVLVMTATPIPRTMALTLYGDLDLSIIDTMPKNRKPIKTTMIGKKQVQEAMILVEREIQMGHRAYFVCPLIEESEKMDTVIDSEALYEKTKQRFPTMNVAILHGQMKAEEKDRIMMAFKRGEIQILVSTTVVEVGIDVPEATVMMIFNAERFGLAQLHQLRGRVGRGDRQSYCVLVEGSGKTESRERIEILTKTGDGLLIAETDLRRRGPGDFFGQRQHGMLEFRVADILTDSKVLEDTWKESKKIIQEDPELQKKEHQLLKKAIYYKHKEMMEGDMMN